MLRVLAAFFSLLALAAGCSPDRAPDAAAPGRDGDEIRPASPETFEETRRELRGRPLLVYFWASWCEPCRREMPLIAEVERRHGSELRILGVNVSDDPDRALRFKRSFGVRFPSLGDRDRSIQTSERVVGLPTMQFYRSDGEMAFFHAGEISAEELEEKVSELVRIGSPRTEAPS